MFVGTTFPSAIYLPYRCQLAQLGTTLQSGWRATSDSVAKGCSTLFEHNFQGTASDLS